LLPGTTWSDTNAINNRDAIVGRSFTDFTARDMVATIWRRGRPSNLNTQVAADDPAAPFVHLQWALLINDRGQIVVQGPRFTRDESRRGRLLPVDAAALNYPAVPGPLIGSTTTRRRQPPAVFAIK
jgi:hypothetical protein